MLKIQIFTFNPFQENTYILYNEKGEAIIIDPGAYFPAEVQTLYDYISRTGLQLKYLLNTHCHLDHIFANKAMAGKYSLELHFHKDEEPVFARGERMGEQYGLPLDTYTGKIIHLEEGDVIQLGNDTLRVILAPGHSPGSICFYCEEQSFLIGGDVLFRESIGRTDFEGSSHEQLLQSIKEKLFTLPDETIVYPGHGPSTTIGYEKVHNPFLS